VTTRESPGDPLDDPRWDLVRAAAGTTVRTPPGLVARVLKSVRGVRGQRLAAPLDIPLDGGLLRIGERVVVLLARRLGAELARKLGGVHISAVALEADGLQVLVTVRYGVAADETAMVLCSRLREALTDQLGIPAPPVHVHIVDVHPN
jgi:hypothetical protein